MSAPAWSPVDDDTATLLTVLADPTPIPGSVEAEWHLYVACLRAAAATGGGLIDPNALPAGIDGQIKAQRVGAFTQAKDACPAKWGIRHRWGPMRGLSGAGLFVRCVNCGAIE